MPALPRDSTKPALPRRAATRAESWKASGLPPSSARLRACRLSADRFSATGRGWARSAKAMLPSSTASSPRRTRHAGAAGAAGGGAEACAVVALEGLAAGADLSQRSAIQRPSAARSTVALGWVMPRRSMSTVRVSRFSFRPSSASLPTLASAVLPCCRASCSSARGPAPSVMPVAPALAASPAGACHCRASSPLTRPVSTGSSVWAR